MRAFLSIELCERLRDWSSWRFASSWSTGRRPSIGSRARARRSSLYTGFPALGAGGGLYSSRWRSIAASTCSTYRVSDGVFPAAELTGWLGRWLDAAALESVDLIGHSLGGLIAAELAAEQPQRAHRLVLVAPAGIPSGDTIFGHGVRLLGTLYDVRGRLPTIVGDAVRTGPLSLLRGALFASDRDLSVELASVRARTLLVWGEDDRLVPARIAAEWQRILPGSRLVRLPCGHVPMWEAPRELASCLLAFLDEELVDDPCDPIRPGVVDRVRFARDDDEPTVR